MFQGGGGGGRRSWPQEGEPENPKGEKKGVIFPLKTRRKKVPRVGQGGTEQFERKNCPNKLRKEKGGGVLPFGKESQEFSGQVKEKKREVAFSPLTREEGGTNFEKKWTKKKKGSLIQKEKKPPKRKDDFKPKRDGGKIASTRRRGGGP